MRSILISELFLTQFAISHCFRSECCSSAARNVRRPLARPSAPLRFPLWSLGILFSPHFLRKTKGNFMSLLYRRWEFSTFQSRTHRISKRDWRAYQCWKLCYPIHKPSLQLLAVVLALQIVLLRCGWPQRLAVPSSNFGGQYLSSSNFLVWWQVLLAFLELSALPQWLLHSWLGILAMQRRDNRRFPKETALLKRDECGNEFEFK